MYILISISINDIRNNVLVSKKKKTIIEYLKNKGYYYSKAWNRYIDDKNNKDESTIDYRIEKIEHLKLKL